MYCNVIVSQKPLKLKAIKYNKKHSKYCAFAVKDIELKDTLKDMVSMIKEATNTLKTGY